MPSVSVLFVGDAERPDFADAAQTIRQMCTATFLGSPQAALAHLERSGTAPDLIVIAQVWPGQYPAAAIDCLRRLAPLARMVALLGSWCEGEARSGSPWPGVVRVYWHQWQARFAQQVKHLIEGQCASWGLPLTATDDERLLWERPDMKTTLPAALVLIHSSCFDLADCLAEALRTRELATLCVRGDVWPDVRGVTLAIWDCPDTPASWADQLSMLAARVAPAPIVAVAGFPRPEDDERLRQAGAAVVLSKPLVLDELFWQVERLLARPSGRAT